MKLRVFESISVDGYFTDRQGERLEGDLVEAVRALKGQEGRGITVLGSGSIAALLGDAGLVDEYQFVVIPIALGGGRTIFTKGAALRLVQHRAFRCGNVVLTYAISAG